ncbi:MAG TPA: alpha-glucan family phosphorylase [Candidatus Binatia bacterium]|nr:alpha-glucan family phosphorylase [Candidatus Binatia bacterium]
MDNAEEEIIQLVPKRIERIVELANNLWWSWDEDGRQVFRSLDYELWRASGHNPVKQLRDINPDKLEAAAKDPAFLELYDSVFSKFYSYMSRQKKDWCGKQLPEDFEGQVAYFSAEYAIHNSLPIYAGGLGVLAGDICKQSSDIGLPFVAIGFMYPQGYFRQRVIADGWQEEVYTQLDFSEAPISPCAWPQGCGPFIAVPLGDRQIFVQVWQVRVGRVNLYLLDTNISDNRQEDRGLSARLYTADQEERLRQLIVLGVGGVRALRELRINPVVWHANEDHTAFMMLERLREERAKGTPIEEAIGKVRRNTVFTTHTPVAAGQHIFPNQLMDRYAQNFWEPLGIDRESFLKLGNYSGLDPEKFSLSAFALRLAGQANGVSRLHGTVARRMWSGIFPGKSEEEIPIISITNGVHSPSWRAVEVSELFEKQIQNAISPSEYEELFWKYANDIPDEQFWNVHQLMKNRLIRTIQDRAQLRLVRDGVSTQQVLAMGALLDPYALTIAFTRRFTQYKRPYLILSDSDRLKKIVTDPLRPVQIIFGGKSHPADFASKELLKIVYNAALDKRFQGRIVFVEDYDMNLARELVRGVDIWLNTPRRLQEACGTSGMKASMNGVINLSIRDGWWDEAYNGLNGWAIGENFEGGNPEEEDKADAESLYSLLENGIVPLYYERDRKGIPHRWIQVAKEAIKTINPVFNACRMMREYVEQMYIPVVFSESSKGNPVIEKENF